MAFNMREYTEAIVESWKELMDEFVAGGNVTLYSDYVLADLGEEAVRDAEARLPCVVGREKPKRLSEKEPLSEKKLLKFGNMLQDAIPKLRKASQSAKSISVKLKSTCSAMRAALGTWQPQLERKSSLEMELAGKDEAKKKKKNPPLKNMPRLSQNQKKELKATMEVAVDKYLKEQSEIRALPIEIAVEKDLSDVELMLLEHYHKDKIEWQKWKNTEKWLMERKKCHEKQELQISRCYSVFFGLVASKYPDNPVFIVDTFIINKMSQEPISQYWETPYVKHILGNEVVYKFKELYKQLQ